MTARAALLAVVALLAAGLLLAAPASAADAEVRLTPDGPVPAAVTLPSGGGTVRFVADDAVSHTLTSDSFGEQQLGGLGGRREVELDFRAPGQVAYTDRRNRLVVPQEQPGSITVAPPAPAEPAPPAQPPDQQPAPVGTSAAPSDAGRTPQESEPAAREQPVPSLGPADVAQPPPGASPLREPTAADASEPVTVAAALRPVQAIEGPLPGAPTSRPLGLPAALAALAALGVASLIVRVLLAEPVARDV